MIPAPGPGRDEVLAPVVALLRSEHRIKHPAALAVDSGLPVDVLDRVVYPADAGGPAVTVRDLLAEVAAAAVAVALADLPDGVLG